MARQRSEQFLHKVEEEKAAIEPLRRLHDQWVTERDALEQQVREALEAKLQAQRVAFFGQLGQIAASGAKAVRIAEVLGVTRQTVYRWLREYEQEFANVATASVETRQRYELVGAGYNATPWAGFQFKVRDNDEDFEGWVEPGAAEDSWEWNGLSTVKKSLPKAILELKPADAHAAYALSSGKDLKQWDKWGAPSGSASSHWG